MIFPEGLATEKEFAYFSETVRKVHPQVFLLANMTEFGKTEYIPFETFSQIGYNCVIYPVSTLRIAMKAVERFVDDLSLNGTVKNSLENMQHRKELYELLKYKPGDEWIYPNPKDSKKI
jgi:methylisocitrate lyase